MAEQPTVALLSSRLSQASAGAIRSEQPVAANGVVAAQSSMFRKKILSEKVFKVTFEGKKKLQGVSGSLVVVDDLDIVRVGQVALHLVARTTIPQTNSCHLTLFLVNHFCVSGTIGFMADHAGAEVQGRPLAACFVRRDELYEADVDALTDHRFHIPRALLLATAIRLATHARNVLLLRRHRDPALAAVRNNW